MCLSAGIVLNDFFMFDTATVSWINLSPLTIGTVPSVRRSHGFISSGSKLFVHAGLSSSSSFGKNGMNSLNSAWLMSFSS